MALRSPVRVSLAREVEERDLYDLADQVQQLIDADQAQTWTPSRVARKVKADYQDVYTVLRYLFHEFYIDSDERGAWTHYFHLTLPRRSSRIAREV
jgi:IS30 family transposase